MRVDHVGSLLRPESLKEAFRDHALGKLDAGALRAAQGMRRSGTVVAKQESLGLPVVTDGEFRRLNWQVSFSEIAGWDLWSGSWKKLLSAIPATRPRTRHRSRKGDDAVLSFRVPATGRLSLTRNFPFQEFSFFEGTAQTISFSKITLMGPDRVAQMCDIEGSHAALRRRGRIPRRCSRDPAAAWSASWWTPAASYVQIDEPSYTGYVDPATLERMQARGEDPDEAAGTRRCCRQFK